MIATKKSLDRLTGHYKLYFEKLYSEKATEPDFSSILSALSYSLYSIYKERSVIIIDEYDTPIECGYLNGYYDEVISFIRNLFSNGFKDNDYLKYGFITGILRVAKESLFSGMNNLFEASILDDEFSQHFGFTEEEVKTILKDKGQEDKFSEISEWYDGYQFGTSHIFNPWSIILYLTKGSLAMPYWEKTGNNDILGYITETVNPENYESLNLLMQEKSIEEHVDDSIIYPEIDTKPNFIFSFLLNAGYLTAIESKRDESGLFLYSLAIPNKEIKIVYKKEILSKLEERISSHSLDFSRAMKEGDTKRFEEAVREILLSYVIYFDTSAEGFYLRLMLGLLLKFTEWDLYSNREEGYGRFDFRLISKKANVPSIVIEIKAEKRVEKLKERAEVALNQIIEKEYYHGLKKPLILYGIAFNSKDAALSSKAELL